MSNVPLSIEKRRQRLINELASACFWKMGTAENLYIYVFIYLSIILS